MDRANSVRLPRRSAAACLAGAVRFLCPEDIVQILHCDVMHKAEGLSGKEKIVYRAGGFLSGGDKIKPVLVKQSAN